MATKIEDYNASSRRVECKLLIHFPTPLEVTQDNYLIDLDILEEAGASSSEPFGSLSSNELAVSLYNDAGLFSPTNKTSPYYGLFKQGLKIEVFFKVNEQLTWDPCGVYYVTSWQASITGTTATILANDILLDVFSKPMKPYYIKKDVSYKDFLHDLFLGVDIAATIDPNIEGDLAFAYTTTGTHDCLAKVVQAARAVCNSNKMGIVEVKSLSNNKPIVYTLADTDQIVEIKNSSDAIRTYDNGCINIGIPSLGTEETVLSISEYTIPKGTVTHNPIKFEKSHIYIPSNLSLTTSGTVITEITFDYTPEQLLIKTSSTLDTQCKGTLAVKAIVLNITRGTMGLEEGKVLTIDNEYMQSSLVTNKYLQLLDNYVNSPCPMLNIRIRGNPLISIGDKVQVISEQYKVDMQGTIMRIKTTYNGGLSSEIDLLDSQILEVV